MSKGTFGSAMHRGRNYVVPMLLAVASLLGRDGTAEAAIIVNTVSLQNSASYSASPILLPGVPSSSQGNNFTVPSPSIVDTVSVDLIPPPSFPFVYASALSSISASLSSTSITLDGYASATALFPYASADALFDLEVVFTVTAPVVASISSATTSTPGAVGFVQLLGTGSGLLWNPDPNLSAQGQIPLTPNEQYTLTLTSFGPSIGQFVDGRVSITAVPEVSSIATASISVFGSFAFLVMRRLKPVGGKR